MKTIISALAICAVLCGCKTEYEKNFTREHGVVANPGQGWMSIYSKENPKLPYGSRYVRFHWRDLEPEEGKYNWEPIERQMERAAKMGVPFSFRVMCASSHSSTPYAAPEWVFEKKGAKFAKFMNRPGGDSATGDTKFARVTPIFDDPIFIKCHARFIKALAEKYDGDPRISTIDIGSYGNWGEWHCTSLGLKKPDVRPHSPEIRRKYADMYLQNFKKTPLIFMTDDHETLEYALGKGEKPRVGIRRDGVGSPSHFKRWIGRWPYENIRNMGDIWKDMPAIFEFFGSVEMMRGRGWDIPYSLGWVLENHACLVNEGPLAPRQIAEGSGEEKLLRDIDLFAGARLVPQSAEVSYADGKLKIRIAGENKGASKIYLPYRFVYVLRGDSGDAAEMVSARDPREILPGKFEFCDEFEVPLERGKEYSLSLRVRHAAGVLKDFRFAAKNLNPDGSLGLGKILIK